MLVVFWDIDGTILTTQRAGMAAWEIAVAAQAGPRPDLGKLATAGRTDVEIAQLLAEQYSLHDGRLLSDYEDALPTALTARETILYPNVATIVAELRKHPDTSPFLLTGNTFRGAQAKLARVDLADAFDGGAFSSPLSDRRDIARQAVALARQRFGDVDSKSVLVGDTLDDAVAARAAGLRFFGVGTGPCSPAELLEAGAWKAAHQLPDPRRFLRYLEGEVYAEAVPGSNVSVPSDAPDTSRGTAKDRRT